MKKNIFFLFLILAKLNIAQTVGLLHHSNLAYDGFTLFTPENSFNVYLVDNCGNKINEWTFTEEPGLTCYLLENGTLLRAGKNKIERRDWDNTLLWQYDLSTLGLNQHHDIEPLPNGNIICLVKDIIPQGDLLAAGKNPSLIGGDLRSEKIIEFQPVGTNAATIVWEWKFIDRIIQDYDATKDNYGNVTANPQRIDFNYEPSNSTNEDWIHMNSIDYNEDLDQIIMSSKSLGEIYIIDHSTTTQEAASHTGGTHQKGGDFLWRWGNPEVYRQGVLADRKLFEQHDAKWVTKGYTNDGKITVFNNAGDGSYTHSSIHLLEPSLDINNNYIMNSNKYLPSDFFWSWDGDILGETVFSGKKCGTQALPNGNMIFCETPKGRLAEVTPSGSIVWIYTNPVSSTIYNQFQTPVNVGIFRGEKYPLNYIGFTGKDVSPKGLIEDQNTNSDTCNSGLSISEQQIKAVYLINNPVKNNTLQFSAKVKSDLIEIINISGKLISKTTDFNDYSLPLSNSLENGIYFISIQKESVRQVLKFVIK